MAYSQLVTQGSEGVSRPPHAREAKNLETALLAVSQQSLSLLPSSLPPPPPAPPGAASITIKKSLLMVNNIILTIHGVIWALDLLGWSLHKVHKRPLSMLYT